jgi:hypothetical protein
MVTKGNLLLNPSKTRDHAANTHRRLRNQLTINPMKSGITTQECVDYPLIKKSLPGHPQGVGDTYSEGDRSTGPQLKFGGWYTPIASFSRGHRPSACRSGAVTMDLKVDALCSAQYSLACTGTARHLLWLICDMCAIARSLLTRSMRWISAAFTTLTRRRIRSVAVLCVISSGIQRRLRSQAADGARTMTRSTAIGTDQRRTARTGHRRPGRHLHP